MLARLPISSETHVLREEIKSIQVKLNMIKDDVKAQQIIENRFKAVYQKILEKPSYEQEFNVFMKLLEVKAERQAINGLGLSVAKDISDSST